MANKRGEAFNYHYQAHGYHPKLCFDGMTGDLLKVELRPGAQYCSNGAAAFMRPLLEEYQRDYPSTALFARGDSGFAANELYSLFETNGTSYVIRLKENAVLRKLEKDLDFELYDLTREDVVSYAAVYGEFEYKAGSWDYPRRVVCIQDNLLEQQMESAAYRDHVVNMLLYLLRCKRLVLI